MGTHLFGSPCKWYKSSSFIQMQSVTRFIHAILKSTSMHTWKGDAFLPVIVLPVTKIRRHLLETYASGERSCRCISESITMSFGQCRRHAEKIIWSKFYEYWHYAGTRQFPRLK